MRNLFLIGGNSKPEINFNAEKGTLELSGHSYHEDTFEVFKLALEWIDEYVQEIGTGCSITFNFRLVYFNTSSARIFFQMLSRLQNAKENKDAQVKINWYYPEIDEDLLEFGQEFAEEIAGLEFNFIAC